MENFELTVREMNFIKFLKSKILNEPGINHNKLRYFALTRKELSHILKCSLRTVDNLIKKLSNINVILKEELSYNKMNHTMYYTLHPYYDNAVSDLSVAQSMTQDNFAAAQSRFSGSPANAYIRNAYARAKNNNIINNNINNKINTARARDDNENLIKEKPTTIQDMLKIWYEEFPDRPVKLTRQICGYMLGTFRLKFNNSLENWRQYLLKIKSSAYLMSEKFTIRILNLLKFSFINKIFNNLLGVKGVTAEVPSKTEREFSKEAESHISSLSESPKCKEIRREVVQRHGAAWYISWFKDICLRGKPSGEVIISSPSSFTVDWICNNTQVYDFTKGYSKCGEVV